MSVKLSKYTFRRPSVHPGSGRTVLLVKSAREAAKQDSCSVLARDIKSRMCQCAQCVCASVIVAAIEVGKVYKKVDTCGAGPSCFVVLHDVPSSSNHIACRAVGHSLPLIRHKLRLDKNGDNNSGINFSCY